MEAYKSRNIRRIVECMKMNSCLELFKIEPYSDELKEIFLVDEDKLRYLNKVANDARKIVIKQ